MKPREKKSSSTASRIKTLSRGLQALEEVCRQDTGITQSELARRLLVDRSTALRFLATLQLEGYVLKDGGGLYHPTLKLARLSGNVLENLEIRRQARPQLERLAEETGLSSHLAILSDLRVVYVDGRHGPGMMRVNTDVGATAPVHCTATGKALAAYLPGEERRRILKIYLGEAARFPSYTAKTITGPPELEREFALVRQQGYALDDQEFEPGVRCLAAPVFDLADRVTAAAGVSGITARLNADSLPKIAAAVCRFADAISRSMGCGDPPKLRKAAREQSPAGEARPTGNGVEER